MTKKDITRARRLRRNMTDAERKFWSVVRNRGLNGAKFRRQVPIGTYIVDFVCLDAKLVVELDGGQHADYGRADAVRTRYLEKAGYGVIRFWNNDVLNNMEGVIQTVTSALCNKS